MKKPNLGQQAFINEVNEPIQNYGDFVRNQRRNKPRFTGRYFIIFNKEEDSPARIKSVLRNRAGLRTANSSDFEIESLTDDAISDADVLIYDNLGVALVGAESDQIGILESMHNSFQTEPEKIVYLPENSNGILQMPHSETWGLRATKVVQSKFSGENVKVAILDTGFTVNHPDFAGRRIVTASFVDDHSQPNDYHGHGTHCIGTACGHEDNTGQRYGIAYNSTIYSGKVLGNDGRGAQDWILKGIEWAVNSGCKVISMSLGSPVRVGDSHSPAYESVAQYARNQGSIIVAAVGNDSDRANKLIGSVSSPANCPSVLGVGAITQNMQIANFSNRQLNPGQEVDIAAPGVNIYSSWTNPQYHTISGTSMATPHVAGILALLWEAYPNASPDKIIEELRKLAAKLPLDYEDVGVGMAIAP